MGLWSHPIRGMCEGYYLVGFPELRHTFSFTRKNALMILGNFSGS